MLVCKAVPFLKRSQYFDVYSRKLFSTTCANTPKDCVRVRFAPSPTGSLHIGGARTAIYNWLMAKKNNGQFIIRVEDTDEARSSRESESSILKDLSWLELHWDEGPDVGGKHKPYRQSERKHLHEVAVDALLKTGHAYRCFSQDKPRDRHSTEPIEPHVPSPWRDAKLSDIQHELSANTPYTVKFKVPAGKKVTLQDRIFGEVMWDTDTCLNDFVIVRSNGMPVYNFCVAVDDMDMQITHVVRAQEHLTNTLKQLLVLEALGHTPPTYAHCSILLGADGTKLSKRHGAASVGQYREQGYLPEAIVSYLGNFANSNKVNKTEEPTPLSSSSGKPIKAKKAVPVDKGVVRVVYSLDEIIGAFSLDNVHRGPAVFDVELLKHINREHIRVLSADRIRSVVVSELMRDFPSSDDSAPFTPSILLPAGEELLNNEQSPVVEAFLAQAVKIALRNITLTGDVSRLVGKCLKYDLQHASQMDSVASQVLASPAFLLVGRALLRDHASGALPCGSDEAFPERWAEYAKRLGEELGLKGKKLFQPLRLCATGCSEGPEIFDQLRLVALAFEEDAARFVNPAYGAVSMARRMAILSEVCAKLEVASTV